MMEQLNSNEKGVTIQNLKDANLNFPIFEDHSAKKLVKSRILQIDHVVNILGVTEKLVNDFRQPILNKYPDIKQEQIALPEGYVSNASDYHGDLTAFLSQLLFAGAITIDKNRLVAVDLDTGKVYSTLDEITELHRQIESGELTHYNEGAMDYINNRIVYLPYTEINPNFKGRINFLGDYLDRGAESQFILGYIEYLSQLNKQTENPINMKFFLGNHDVPGVCGGQDRNKIMPSNPYYENVIKRMLYDEDIFEVCDVVKNENGTFDSYAHALFTILDLPEMFNLLKVFLNEDANIEKYIENTNEFIVNALKDAFPKARQYFFDKFMNANEESLSKDYVNLRNKINKLKDQLKNLELVTQYGTSDNIFYEACFKLRDQLIKMGFSYEDFLYLKNILAKAAWLLHTSYSAIPTLLGSDLGKFFGVRLRDKKIDGKEDINNIEKVEVWNPEKKCREIKSIALENIIQNSGHTPDESNRFQFSPYFRDYDAFMSGGYNRTENKEKQYPEGTANISKLKFTFVNQNDNNTVLLTPNYYIYRDENQRILPGENFKKVDINEDAEKKFVDGSIKLDCSTEKMIEMFALNFTDKDKNLDDKDDKSEKNIPDDTNDNDNDDHDLGNDDDNDDDGKPQKGGIKIQTQQLKAKDSSEIDAETRRITPDAIKRYKECIDTLQHLDKTKSYLYYKVDQFFKLSDESITLQQLEEELGKELNFLYECCISLSNYQKFDNAEKRNEEMKKFLSSSIDGKISEIRFLTTQQVKLEELFNGVYEQINKSYFTAEKKNELIAIMENPAIPLPIRLNNVFENVLNLCNIGNKELYLEAFRKSSSLDKIKNLNIFIESVLLILFFDKEISDDGLKNYFTNMIQIQLSDPITEGIFNSKLSKINEKIVSLYKDYLFVKDMVADYEKFQKINEFKSKDIKGKIEILNEMQDKTKKLQTYQQKFLEFISKIPSNQEGRDELADIVNNQEMSFRKKLNAIYQKLLKLDQKGEIKRHSNFSDKTCSAQMVYLEEHFEIYLKQINTAESKDEVTKDDNPTDELTKSSQEIEVSVNIEDEKTKEISDKISEYRKAIENGISIDDVKNNLIGILNVPITNEENFLPQIEGKLAKELNQFYEDCLSIRKNGDEEDVEDEIKSKRESFEKSDLKGKISKLEAINGTQKKLGGYCKNFDNLIKKGNFKEKDKSELFSIINSREISFSDKLNSMFKYLLNSYHIEGENLFEDFQGNASEDKVKILNSCFECAQLIILFNEISDKRYKDYLNNIIQKQSVAPRSKDIFKDRLLEASKKLNLWYKDYIYIEESNPKSHRTVRQLYQRLFSDGEIKKGLKDAYQKLRTIISDDSIGEETRRKLSDIVDNLEISFEEKLNNVYPKLLELREITEEEKNLRIAEFKNAKASDRFNTLEKCIETLNNKNKNNIDKESNSKDVTKTPVMRQRPNQRGLIPGLPSKNNKNAEYKVPIKQVRVPGYRYRKNEEIKPSLNKYIFINIEDYDAYEKNLSLLYEDCLYVQGFSKESRDLYMQIFNESDSNKKRAILKLHRNEQMELQRQYEERDALISNSSIKGEFRVNLLNELWNGEKSFAEKLNSMSLTLLNYFKNYLSEHGITSEEEQKLYCDKFEKFSFEDKISTLGLYNEFSKQNRKFKQENQDFRTIRVFSNFINKSNMTLVEKINAVAEFKDKTPKEKEDIVNEINAMEKQNKAMEKQNEENSKAENFKTLPLHRIPPTEPAPKLGDKPKGEER